MENRKEYIDKMAARLKEWDNEILRMEAKVISAKADVKAEYHKQLMELLNKKDVIQQKLQHIKDASEDAWMELKSGTESSWEIMEDAIKNAWLKIK